MKLELVNSEEIEFRRLQSLVRRLLFFRRLLCFVRRLCPGALENLPTPHEECQAAAASHQASGDTCIEQIVECCDLMKRLDVGLSKMTCRLQICSLTCLHLELVFILTL